MDRPPSGPVGGEQFPRDNADPTREPDPHTPPGSGYVPSAPGSPDHQARPPRRQDSSPPPAPTDAAPDPYGRHAGLYRPHYGDPAGSAVPADSMPTEPIPVLRLPGWDSGNARYEGSWSDWVARASADVPESEGVVAAGSGAAPLPTTEQPPEAAETTGVTQAEPGTPTADTSVAGARERLRRRLTPPGPTTPAPAQATAGTSARSRMLPVLLGVAGVTALGAAAYVQFAVIGGDEPRAPTAAAPSATVPAATGADPHCVPERIGNTVQGNEAGGTDSGPSAIFGFQHAYYVARSGEQARALVAGDAAVPPAADIQRGIDTIPEGTTYCVRIAPGAFVGQYTVTVTEYRPGAAPLGYNPQLVTTMRIGDQTLITGIGPMP